MMTSRGFEAAGLLLLVFSAYCAQRSDPPLQQQIVAEAPPPPPAPKKPRVVLHVGDSMVGYGHGLSLAMKKRYATEGIEYHWDAWTSAQVQTLDDKKMDRLLAAFKPDLVLFNLGTNNLSVPHPEALADGIHRIAEHLAEGGRECVWIAPIRPKWKYNPRIYDVLRDNVAPCRYFDAGPIDPPLQTDHIHPTDTGGEEWAAPLWTFLQALKTT
jgi:lysophospholipase L1-like esterase